jgi:UDP-glucose 4-epimerase
MSQKIVLITGWLWYIGSHAVVAFEELWYKTVIVDNLVHSSQETLLWIWNILWYCPDFYEWDIRDRVFLRSIFEKYIFDGVIHFAGLKSVNESCDDLYAYQNNNITGSIELFGVMHDFGVKNILFSSSAAVYHAKNISPITEDMPLGSTNPYATTKIIIEHLLQDYALHDWWSVMNLRYFNPIGAHDSGYIGEIPQWVPNNLLPYVLYVALGKYSEVKVYGDTYSTPDGTGVRDYIDVNDLVDAHAEAYISCKNSGFTTYNVGTGVWKSVLDVIHAVENVSGKTVPYVIGAPRNGDLAMVYADNSKILDGLHWKAKRDFTHSIQTALNFL